MEKGYSAPGVGVDQQDRITEFFNEFLASIDLKQLLIDRFHDEERYGGFDFMRARAVAVYTPMSHQLTA